MSHRNLRYTIGLGQYATFCRTFKHIELPTTSFISFPHVIFIDFKCPNFQILCHSSCILIISLKTDRPSLNSSKFIHQPRSSHSGTLFHSSSLIKHNITISRPITNSFFQSCLHYCPEHDTSSTRSMSDLLSCVLISSVLPVIF